MANTLKLEIVTPEGTVYSEDVEMVTLPGVEGQMGIFPQHVPLMTQMVPGEIIVRKDGRDLFLATGEGFVEVTGNSRRHPDRHGHSGRPHRRSQSRRSAATRRSPSPGKALRRGSRFRQCLARPLPGAIARQATPTRVIWSRGDSRKICDRRM